MASMNLGKVVAGGIAAGFVINVVEAVVNFTVLAGPAEEAMTALGLDPVSGAAIGGFVVLGFALGIATAWVYAAIRPRFGAGPSTAIKAGLAVWVGFYFFGTISNWLTGIIGLGFALIIFAYSILMMAAAGYVGGMVYKEE